MEMSTKRYGMREALPRYPTTRSIENSWNASSSRNPDRPKSTARFFIDCLIRPPYTHRQLVSVKEEPTFECARDRFSATKNRNAESAIRGEGGMIDGRFVAKLFAAVLLVVCFGGPAY